MSKAHVYPEIAYGDWNWNNVIEQSEPLNITHPELVKEWHSKNKLTPNNVTAGSGQKVWWKCSCGYEWEATISARANGHVSCLKCRSIATVIPDIINWWDDEKDYNVVNSGSHSIIRLKCPECETPKQVIAREVAIYKLSCGYCNSFGKKYPQYIDEWHESNREDPFNVASRSNKIIKFKCKKCGDIYSTRVINKAKGKGKCTRCLSLAITHPKIAKRYSKNNPETAYEIRAGSGLKRNFVCFECKTDYSSVVHTVVSSNRLLCRFCHFNKQKKPRVKDGKSMRDTHPKIAERYSKNNPETANEISANSKFLRKFVCSKCKKDYLSIVYSQIRATGMCVRCLHSNRKPYIETPFEDARKFAHSLNLKSKREWHNYCKSDNKPSHIPACPRSRYKEEWKGWRDWLGKK